MNNDLVRTILKDLFVWRYQVIKITEGCLLPQKSQTSFALIVCNKLDSQKAQSVTTFTIFGIVRFFEMKIFCLITRFSQWHSTLYPNF